MKCIVIPDDPAKPIVYDHELDTTDTLGSLQAIVGGFIEAVPIPALKLPAEVGGSIHEGAANRATAYINEEGKYDPKCQPNMRATDFFVPGVGIFPRDFIAGPLLLIGFDPETGEHDEQLPDDVVARVRLIDSEAGVRA